MFNFEPTLEAKLAERVSLDAVPLLSREQLEEICVNLIKHNTQLQAAPRHEINRRVGKEMAEYREIGQSIIDGGWSHE